MQRQLKPCDNCGKPISPLAESCPHCGDTYPNVSEPVPGCAWVAVIAVMIPFLWLMGQMMGCLTEFQEEAVPALEQLERDLERLK